MLGTREVRVRQLGAAQCSLYHTEMCVYDIFFCRVGCTVVYIEKSEKFSGYNIDSQCEFEKEKFRDTFMVNSERQIEQSSE